MTHLTINPLFLAALILFSLFAGWVAGIGTMVWVREWMGAR